ncbi:MAG TPA: glycosyltransferase family 39 protein [Candidatus Moranbacteria bacterium]|nr:glycosyltransferase family 39 protein [Candidatus Moranbacteria bacterium]
MNLTKKHTITILIIIILLGAILRFYKLGATSFVADEFLDINSSMAYAKTGVWQNWDFNFGQVNKDNVFEARDSRAWIYKWQVAQILKIFGASEVSARSVSVIWGLISIGLIYFVAAYFTKKKEIGLLAAALFAISITGIIFDRRLRMYAMFFPVFLAFSWMIFRFLEEEYKGKIKVARYFYEKLEINLIYLAPMLVLGAISILTHQLTGNIVIIFFVYALILAVQKYRKNKSFINKYFLGICAIVFSFILGKIFFPAQLGAYTAGIDFPNSHWSYIINVFSDYSNLILALAFLAAGVYHLYKTENLRKESLWLSVSFFSVLFSAILLWDRNVGDQYIFFAESFSIILIASGIYAMLWFFEKNLEKFGKKIIYIPLALALLILPNWAYFFEKSNAYRQTSASDSVNYKKIFSYFNKSRKAEDVLVTRNFRNFYWKGGKIKIFSFGGEISNDKLTMAEIQEIVSQNPSGWVIISDNDDVYIANDAEEWIDKNIPRVSNSYVRGKVSVYRWGN